MTPTTPRLRTFQLALLASAVLGLSACSRNGSDTAASTASASAPDQAAVAPAVNSSVAVAPPPAAIMRNESTYAQAEHELPPRADRDVDNAPPPDVDQQRWRHPHQVAAASCRDCGVVEAIHAVKTEARTSGVGAVAGGVGGALVGNSIAGRNDRAIGGIVGAVGGSLLGNAIEKHERTTTVYDVNVRMSDGSLRTVRQTTAPAVGERVRVEADGLHARA